MLARRRPRHAAAPALVQIRAQGIACDLHARFVNPREQRVTYELTVANKGDVRVACRIYGLDPSSHTREFGMLTIGKQSAGSSFFVVPFATSEHCRMYVEVVGDGINLFAEAFQPTSRADAGWPRLVAACALLSIATAFGTTYAFDRRAGARPAAHRREIAANVLHPKSLAPRSADTGNAPSPKVAAERVHPAGAPVAIAALLVNAWHSLHFGRPAGLKTPATLASGALSLPARIVAGQDFSVSVQSPAPGQRIAFEDNLKAVVDEVTVSARTARVTFSAPASQTEETYYLASTVGRGSSRETSVRSLRVYPP